MIFSRSKAGSGLEGSRGNLTTAVLRALHAVVLLAAPTHLHPRLHCRGLHAPRPAPAALNFCRSLVWWPFWVGWAETAVQFWTVFSYNGDAEPVFMGFTDFIFLGSKITTDGDCSHEIKRRTLFPPFPHLFPMKWWDQMPWSSFSECWALSQLFHSPLHFYQEVF